MENLTKIGEPFLARQMGEDSVFSYKHTINQSNNFFASSRWRTDAILKIVFWLYLGAILTDQCEIWIGNTESYANTDHMTKTAIFENSRWRTAAILKIALSPYLSRELSDFSQIWYIDTNLHSKLEI